MPQAPILPFSVGDYRQDTLELELEEHGAYLLLMMAQWSRNGDPLPANERLLMRLVGCTDVKQWRRVWATIEHFFETSDGLRPDLKPTSSRLVSHKRVAQDHAKVAAKIEVNRQNASKGGTAKASNRSMLPKRTPAKRYSKESLPTQEQTLDNKSSDGLPNLNTEPIRKSENVILNWEEEKNLEEMYRWFLQFREKKWPNDPTPRTRTSDFVWADCQHFASVGVSQQTLAYGLVRDLSSLSSPPVKLNTEPWLRKIHLEIWAWTERKRWQAKDDGSVDPWPNDHDHNPPSDEILATWFVPGHLRRATDDAPVMPEPNVPKRRR